MALNWRSPPISRLLDDELQITQPPKISHGQGSAGSMETLFRLTFLYLNKLGYRVGGLSSWWGPAPESYNESATSVEYLAKIENCEGASLEKGSLDNATLRGVDILLTWDAFNVRFL